MIISSQGDLHTLRETTYQTAHILPFPVEYYRHMIYNLSLKLPFFQMVNQLWFHSFIVLKAKKPVFHEPLNADRKSDIDVAFLLIPTNMSQIAMTSHAIVNALRNNTFSLKLYLVMELINNQLSSLSIRSYYYHCHSFAFLKTKNNSVIYLVKKTKNVKNNYPPYWWRQVNRVFRNCFLISSISENG